MGNTKQLTKKQTAFRDAILEGFTPSQAYRKAFDAKGMSKKSISVNAAKLLRNPKITLAITLATNNGQSRAVAPPVPAHVEFAMVERLETLRTAATLDPIDCFDELNHFKPIREMPEQVRRAIVGFEVDPLSFVTKVKFIDKRGAIMDYSRLRGDIPREQACPPPPSRENLAWDALSFDEQVALREGIAEVIERIRQQRTTKVLNAPNGHANGSTTAA